MHCVACLRVGAGGCGGWGRGGAEGARDGRDAGAVAWSDGEDHDVGVAEAGVGVDCEKRFVVWGGHARDGGVGDVEDAFLVDEAGVEVVAADDVVAVLGEEGLSWVEVVVAVTFVDRDAGVGSAAGEYAAPLFYVSGA
jgi:hypothetical protein